MRVEHNFYQNFQFFRDWEGGGTLYYDTVQNFSIIPHTGLIISYDSA